MTDPQPETCWVVWGQDWKTGTAYTTLTDYKPQAPRVEYLRADTAVTKAEAEAMAGAAFEKVASLLDGAADDWDEDGPTREADAIRDEALEIRRHTPADASAAFERAVQEAVEVERERCARIADDHIPINGRPLSSRTTAMNIADAIRANNRRN